jgi:hypothetical protein
MRNVVIYTGHPVLSLWLYSRLVVGRLFSLLILYTVGETPWTGDQPVARPRRTHRTTQTQNKRTQTSMPRVGLLGRGISPSQGRYLHTEQHKRRINAHRHPCLEWDSLDGGSARGKAATYTQNKTNTE